METIKLFISGGEWMARFSDPSIQRLFGTDTIPTSFTSQASQVTVQARIETLNPDCEVTVV